MAKDSDDFELLRLAREQGVITESELDHLMAEHLNDTPRGGEKTPTRLAIEKGMLTEEDTNALETQVWINKLPKDLGGYRIVRLLGRGGMAVVFEAQNLSLGKVVALKVLLPEFSSSDTYLARFNREARIAAKLTHPNTVQVFGAGEEDGIHYLVMEYIEGETLSEAIKVRGRVPEAEALTIIAQVAGALEEAADMGIVHRDIKPGNVLISKWGVPRLSDFGIAKEFTDIRDPRIQLSLTMGVVGTPTYMSPEQARGARQIDFRSDIYSLGATLYHLVVGDVPFFADTPQETMVRVVSESPRPPRSLRPELSEGAAAVICKMMAKRADDRYESYEALAQDLEAAREGEAVSLSYREGLVLVQPVREEEPLAPEDEGQTSVMRVLAIAAGVAVAGFLVLMALRGC